MAFGLWYFMLHFPCYTKELDLYYCHKLCNHTCIWNHKSWNVFVLEEILSHDKLFQLCYCLLYFYLEVHSSFFQFLFEEQFRINIFPNFQFFYLNEIHYTNKIIIDICIYDVLQLSSKWFPSLCIVS